MMTRFRGILILSPLINKKKIIKKKTENLTFFSGSAHELSDDFKRVVKARINQYVRGQIKLFSEMKGNYRQVFSQCHQDKLWHLYQLSFNVGK